MRLTALDRLEGGRAMSVDLEYCQLIHRSSHISQFLGVPVSRSVGLCQLICGITDSFID